METKNNINMRPAPKKNDNGLIGGALGAAIGTAFGATFGVGGAYAYNHLNSDDDIPEVTLDPQMDDEVEVAQQPEPQHHHEVHHVHQTSDVYIVHPQPAPAPGPTPEPTPGPTPGPGPTPVDDEIQILSYERVTLDDGSQVDVATVAINGQPVQILDVDLDGWADGMIADANSDGNISEDEITSFEGTDVRINMGELAMAAGNENGGGDPGNGDDGGGEVVVISDDGGDGDGWGDGSGDGDDGGDGWDDGGGDDGGMLVSNEGDDGFTTDTVYPEDPPVDDDGMLTASNEGGDGVIPDYVNNGDVSDVVTDSDDMLLV